jgi:acetoin:2,6-dichlorophenolindophenol oxidoreductase subunit beta
MTATQARSDTDPIGFGLALNEALADALERDPKVLVFGEDVVDNPHGGVFGVTNGLSTKYGNRVRSTPISEQAILGAGIGAAIAGMRPVAEIMLFNFMTVAMDMLTNHAAKLRYMSGGQTGVPLTVRTAAGAGKGFGAQHSEMLESWLTHIPGLKVVVPSTPADAKGLLTACIFDDDPCVVIEQHHLYFSSKGEVPVGHHVVPLGKADIKRPGSDVTVVTYGRQVHDALLAAAVLAEEGVSVEVLDLRSLTPLDYRAVLDSVARTRRVVVAHEAVRRGGLGAEIAAMINEELFGELDAPVIRVGAPFVPIPYAANLESLYLPGPAEIEKGIRTATTDRKNSR